MRTFSRKKVSQVRGKRAKVCSTFSWCYDWRFAHFALEVLERTQQWLSVQSVLIGGKCEMLFATLMSSSKSHCILNYKCECGSEARCGGHYKITSMSRIEIRIFLTDLYWNLPTSNRISADGAPGPIFRIWLRSADLGLNRAHSRVLLDSIRHNTQYMSCSCRDNSQFKIKYPWLQRIIWCKLCSDNASPVRESLRCLQAHLSTCS